MLLSKDFNTWAEDSTGTVTISNGGARVTLNAGISTFSLVRHSFFAKKGDTITVTVNARLWGGSNATAQLRVDNYNDAGSRSFIAAVEVDSHSWKKYSVKLAFREGDNYGDIFSIGLGFNTANDGGAEFTGPEITIHTPQKELERTLLLGRIDFDSNGDPRLKKANTINIESVSFDAASDEIRIHLKEPWIFPVDGDGINDITEPHVFYSVHRSSTADGPMYLTYCFYVESGGYLRMKFTDAAGVFVSDKLLFKSFQVSFKMTT